MAWRVRPSLLRFFFSILAVASAAAGANHPIGPLGSEFLVNTFTDTREWQSAVAANANGFVVVWHSAPHHDGESDGVFAQRFTSAGTRLGVEFQVNSFTSGYQYYADVAMDAAGDFVVVWQSFAQDGGSNGVFAQRFASDGGRLGVEFQVNTATLLDEAEASVAMDAGGNFVVAWTSFPGDTSSNAVFAQRFGSTGAKLGGEFLVNSFTLSTQKSPQVAMAAGSFVVVWQSFNQEEFQDYGVFGRRFGSNGGALGVEFQVNERTQSTQRHPDVAMGGAGDFAVVWDTLLPGGDFKEVVGRRFDSSGAVQGGDFLVNTHTLEDQRGPAVAKDATGAFVVSWTTYTDMFSREDVFARFFDSAGVAAGSDFQVNASTATRESGPSVAVAAEGRFVVAWESVGLDDYDVYARRLAPYAKLDLDHDGEVAPLTDGLMTLRFLFGSEGAAITAGAIGSACTRCTTADIETYLDSLGLVLDVNDNGSSLEPLTDGVLLLRYLFGFTGTALTTGATSGCTRCDAGDIADYLQPLITRD